MFVNAFSFNQCLNNLDTSSVTDMMSMFAASNMIILPRWYNKSIYKCL